jgi:putative addiction module component (TIGR02574 family)
LQWRQEQFTVGLEPPALAGKSAPNESGIIWEGTLQREETMAPTMKNLGIDRLSPEQRIALALEIWESLDEAHPPGQLTTEQRAELARRDAELDAHPESALTWEQVRVSVESKP